ncbi:MAG TPA: hypothetical protein VI583_08005 [Cyclobacteriaceae bacterium]|nr:hypothetical protein [Cyclobacteriaceae bacterium]
MAGLKIAAHSFDLEIVPREINTYFPSILTGIIFILGFLLAGVVTDYKECEKIPNEIASSLYSLWQEADYLRTVNHSRASEHLMIKLKTVIPVLINDFFILRNDNLLRLIDSLSDDIKEIGKEGTIANYMVRMKNDLYQIRKTVDRINVVKNTEFIPSVNTSILVLAIIFLVIYGLSQTQPWWGGLIIISIFTTIIFTIIFLIQDMKDPFEYDETFHVKSDEVSLTVLEDMQKVFNAKKLDPI